MFVSERRRIRQKFHYFEPIKFHERNPRKRTRSNPPSLVRSIRIPVASSHGDTRAVIKLKGFAISFLEYSIQKSRKRMHIERTGATTCPCSFRIRGYTNRMSNRESGSSNGENWSLCVQPLYPPYCSVVRKYPPCSALPHPFHRFEKSSIFPATLFPPRSVESTGDKVISLCYALPARWSARATLQLFGNWRTQAIVSAIWPVRKSLTSRYYRRFTVSGGGGGGFSRGKSG